MSLVTIGKLVQENDQRDFSLKLPAEFAMFIYRFKILLVKIINVWIHLFNQFGVKIKNWSQQLKKKQPDLPIQ